MKPKNTFIIIGLVILTAMAYFVFDKRDGQAPREAQNSADKSKLTIASNLGLGQQNSTSTAPGDEFKNNTHLVTMKTNMGEIQFETYDADAPKTVKNFIDLANRGFYNGVIFHRVIDGFMVQGGDPTGTGMGGPGYKFNDELNPQAESYKAGYKKGVVAMANSGPNTNGSQFFIMVADYPLPNNYTIFGKVVRGQEVADAIASVKTGANDRPVEAVVMEKVMVTQSGE